MNELDRQDAERYWKISQARCSARVFAEGAETGFTERFGVYAKGGAREAFGAVGSIFYMTSDLLDRQEQLNRRGACIKPRWGLGLADAAYPGWRATRLPWALSYNPVGVPEGTASLKQNILHNNRLLVPRQNPGSGELVRFTYKETDQRFPSGSYPTRPKPASRPKVNRD